MQVLKADTAVKVVIGPVVEVANGYVPVTTLAVSTADEAEMMKHDAAAVTSISANTFAAITSMDGYYNLTLTAAQLDTEGMVTIGINDDSLCLPVRHDFMVVNANVYDSLYGAAATDYLQVDAIQLAGTTQDATDLADFAAAGYDPITNKIQGVVLTDTLSTYTGNTVQTGDNYARLGAPAGASVSADIVAVKADTAAVLVDTSTTLPATLGTPTDTDLATDIANVSTQLSNISNSGSAVNTVASSYTLTTGTQSSGTVVSTEALDGTNHEHTDTAGAMDLYYETNIGSGSPASVTVDGYLNGNNDDLEVHGYDWVAAGWVQVGTLAGKVASTNETNTYQLTTAMVGTGNDVGKVQVRFTDGAFTLTTATLAVDRILFTFNLVTGSYANGIEVDTNGVTNTNTTPGIDGVVGNPVTTWAAALSLAAKINSYDFHIHNGSSITLTGNSDNYTLIGESYTLALGGQSIANAFISGCSSISGVSSGTDYKIVDCLFGSTISLDSGWTKECRINGTITLVGINGYFFQSCFSTTGTLPIIDLGAAVGAQVVCLTPLTGGVQINNMLTGDLVHIEGAGEWLLDSSCTGGTLEYAGDWRETDNSGGAVTLSAGLNTQNSKDILVDTSDMQPKLGTPVTDVSADIAAVKAETALIVVDTNELQGDWTNGGRLDLLLDRLITEMDTATTEPAQGAPGVSVKRGEKIDWLYKVMRNRSTSTATTINVYSDDATTVDHKITHSDDATTYDRGEMATGP